MSDLPDKLYDALHALSYGTSIGPWDGEVWRRTGDELAAAGLIELAPPGSPGRRRVGAKLTEAGWQAFHAEQRARRGGPS